MGAGIAGCCRKLKALNFCSPPQHDYFNLPATGTQSATIRGTVTNIGSAIMEALVADLVSSVTSLQDSISQLRADNGTLRESVSQLLTDNGTLRKSVSQLQEEVKAQKRASDSNQTQLAILQKNNGVLFPKFGQLPIELQR